MADGEDAAGANVDANVDANEGVQLDPFGDIELFFESDLPSEDFRVDAGCKLVTDDEAQSTCDSPPGGGIETIAGSAYFVIRANAVVIDARMEVLGEHPLVILARNITITGQGEIDSGSKSGELVGGAGNQLCGTGDLNATGNAGGAGGGYGAAGGDGGTGAGSKAGPGGTGGLTLALPTQLLGGCPGGDVEPRLGGLGGGAIQLTAVNQLLVEGAINVGGAGGQSGIIGAVLGAAGGGSGGLIVLEAGNIQIANGSIGYFGGAGGNGAADESVESAGGDGSAVGAGLPNPLGTVAVTIGGRGGDAADVAGVDGLNAPGSAVSASGGGGSVGYLITRDLPAVGN